MKKLIMKAILLLALLAGVVWLSGCTAGSAWSLRSAQATELTPGGEHQLIETIEQAHRTWHAE